MKKLLTIELEEDALMSLLPHIMALEADFRVRTPNPTGAVVLTQPAYAPGNAGRKIQRRSPDGRSSRQVVLDKVASFGTKKFHIREVDSVARFTGFAPGTLRPQLQHLVREGLVEKLGRHYFRAVPATVATPVPPVAVDNAA